MGGVAEMAGAPTAENSIPTPPRWDFQERPLGNLVNFTGEGKN